MRKIINSTYISLDGVVEQPQQWPTMERPSDERGGQIQTSLLKGLPTQFELTDSTVLKSGMAILTYRPCSETPSETAPA